MLALAEQMVIASVDDAVGGLMMVLRGRLDMGLEEPLKRGAGL